MQIVIPCPGLQVIKQDFMKEPRTFTSRSWIIMPHPEVRQFTQSFLSTHQELLQTPGWKSLIQLSKCILMSRLFAYHKIKTLLKFWKIQFKTEKVKICKKCWYFRTTIVYLFSKMKILQSSVTWLRPSLRTLTPESQSSPPTIKLTFDCVPPSRLRPVYTVIR